MLRDYQEGDYVETPVYVEMVEKREDRKGNFYLSLLVRDKSTSVNAKWWNVPENEQLQEGEVILVQGRMTLFNEKKQLKIQKIQKITEGEAADPSQYQRIVHKSKEALMQEWNEACNEITNERYRYLLKEIWRQEREKISTYPAAKSFHHAYSQGLMTHTLSMFHVAKALCQCYPYLHKDLLLTGVLFHDLGKIDEFTQSNQPQYSLIGNLVGHIVSIVERIDELSLEQGWDLNEEDLISLKHLILAHHGKKEYGSPIEPKLLEAEVLHFIDHLDATIEMIHTALLDTPKGEFTERLAGLDYRQFYHLQDGEE